MSKLADLEHIELKSCLHCISLLQAALLSCRLHVHEFGRLSMAGIDIVAIELEGMTEPSYKSGVEKRGQTVGTTTEHKQVKSGLIRSCIALVAFSRQAILLYTHCGSIVSRSQTTAAAHI